MPSRKGDVTCPVPMSRAAVASLAKNGNVYMRVAFGQWDTHIQ